MDAALKNKHIHCLMYVCQNGAGWYMRAYKHAISGDYYECLIFMHEEGCPYNKEECLRWAEHNIDCYNYIQEYM